MVGMFYFPYFFVEKDYLPQTLTKCEVMFLVVSYSVISVVMSGPETLSHGKLGRVGGSHKKVSMQTDKNKNKYSYSEKRRTGIVDQCRTGIRSNPLILSEN